MRKMMALAVTIPAIALSVATGVAARAQTSTPEAAPVCQQRLSEAKTEWQASGIPASNTRAAGWGSNGAGKAHDHPGMVTAYMQRQLADAEQLCGQGKDHEALLRIDVVRAWLKLPFEEHPASHAYHPKAAQ